MKPDGLRILGWAIPIFCMAVTCWIFFAERQDFNNADLAHNQAQRDLETASREFAAIQEQHVGNRFAAADDLPEEEIAFLTYLRTSCAAAGVNFKSWLSQTVEYGKDKETKSKDPKINELLKGIRKVSASIVLVGDYQNIRRVIGNMEANDRLYTLTNLNWAALNNATQLQVTVSRYVAPAKPALKRAAVKPVTTPPTTPGGVPTPMTPPNSGSHPTPPATAKSTAGPGITTKP